MSRWFRFYADAMRNPKVARLSDKQFRLWVELLAVASENDGSLPCLDDLRYVLNRRLDHLSTGVDQLISMGLIDRLTSGYEPHNWSKFQYKSDTSNERVTKHRAKRNVTVTPPDTETETELPLSKDNGGSDKAFWDNAVAYIGDRGKVGRLLKGRKQSDVARAITEAQLARAVDPFPYVERILRKQASDGVEMPVA